MNIYEKLLANKTDFSNREFLKSYILKHFTYQDGKLLRNDRKGGIGSLDKDGYLIIKVKGKQFKAHHIVWLLAYGDFPNQEIDHINRNKTDNRIENLRLSNRKQQNFNSKNHLEHGVYFDKTKGLKKNYAFKFENKTYRFYTEDEALKKRKELWEGVNYGT